MSFECRIHSNFAIAALSALFLLAGAVPVQAQLGLALVPMRQELKLAPGQEISGALKLSSESGAKTRIRAEIDDFDYDATTTPQFERNLPQEAATSCKTWLSVNPMEIELEQGGFLLVRYTVHVPPTVAEGSYNCAVGFTTLRPADANAAGMGMHMAVRIVSAFYIQIGNPPVAGALKEIRLEMVPPAAPQDGGTQKDAQATDTTWRAVVVLQNQGKMYFRPSGKLEIVDANGKTVETQDFPSLAVLRERTQPIVFPLKTNLQPGHYTLRVNVDIGTGEIQQGTADVVVGTPAPPAAQAKAAPQ